MRSTSTFSFALALLLVAPLARTQQPNGSRPPLPPRHHMDGGDMDGGMRPGFFSMHGMWWKNPDLVKSLNITPDQQKRMDDIFQKSRLELIDLQAALEKQEVILHPMLDENPPDTNKVLAQIDRVAQARADLEKGNARMLLGIRGVLTPDQWTKLREQSRGDRHRVMIRRFHRDGDGHRVPGADGPGTPPPPTP